MMDQGTRSSISTTIQDIPVVPGLDDERINMVLGDYRILCRIGSGAMADVYLAKQISLEREVALKILKNQYAIDETGVRRFVREAQAAAKLEHPNIVHIYEVGSKKIGRDTSWFKRCWHWITFSTNKNQVGQTVHFIAQEYVPGLNLQQYLRRVGPLSVRQTLVILQQICSALEKASHFGIVHRDVKPENILLSKEGLVKITDFGLAYLEGFYGSRSMSLTQTGLTLGTPLYMSPEQAEGKPLDFRSDIYSLGVTAYQMLVGHPPYNGTTLLSVILQHINEPVASIRLIRPNVPEVLSSAVEKMMAKQPMDRFTSFKEIGDLLKGIQNGLTPTTVFETNSSKSTPVQQAISTRLFTDESEKQVFHDTLLEGALSNKLQTSFSKLQALNQQEKKLSFNKGSRRYLLIAALLIALVFGGGIELFSRIRISTPLSDKPASVPIARFETVEEQWVFASQMETAEGWKSVIDFFPEKEYWKRKAQQQLARTYIKEGNVNGAKEIFLEFTEMSPPVQHYLDYGQAGLACCMAMDGYTEHATSMISTLRSQQKNATYDRLTEDIITMTQEMIRRRSGSMRPR